MQVASVPRTLVIAAHPDDETIGAGVFISQSKGIQVVHATDGSPANPSDALAAGFSTREEYALARNNEAARALALAGLPESKISNLHFTDQQLCFCLDDLSLHILASLEQLKPDIILTHAYEGGHPDHDSLALACHIARELYSTPKSRRRLELREFTSYHAGDNAPMCTYEFLPDRELREQSWLLSNDERELKVRMLLEFATQAKTLAPFMSPDFEKFRPAPPYNFSCPPHHGKLFYENFNWGVDGATWRELACGALTRLLH